MEIYLIRHPRVDIDSGLCYGQSDIGLSENFITEAQHYHQNLPTDFDIIFSSPLKRCLQLAKKLDRGEIKTDARLMEINFGSWELKNWNDIPQKEIENWSKDFINYKPGGGENLKEFHRRVLEFIAELNQTKAEKVLIVSHAGVIRCFWQYILDIPLENIMKIPIDYGEIFRIELHDKVTYQRILQKK